MQNSLLAKIALQTVLILRFFRVKKAVFSSLFKLVKSVKYDRNKQIILCEYVRQERFILQTKMQKI
jgi:hypothetical protein